MLFVVICRKRTLTTNVEYTHAPVPSGAYRDVDGIQRALLSRDEMPYSRDARKVVVLDRVLGHLAERNRISRSRERRSASELLSYRVSFLGYYDRNIHPEMEFLLSYITASYV